MDFASYTASMDPETLEVKTPQQRRKRNNPKCAPSNEIGHETLAWQT
jgi:hypothetical protein